DLAPAAIVECDFCDWSGGDSCWLHSYSRLRLRGVSDGGMAGPGRTKFACRKGVAGTRRTLRAGTSDWHSHPNRVMAGDLAPDTHVSKRSRRGCTLPHGGWRRSCLIRCQALMDELKGANVARLANRHHAIGGSR